MNETMPISAGLPAGMTTDACLEAQLRSAFLTGETDGEEAGLRPEFVINDPDRRIKVLTVIEDELARCTSFDISVAFVTMSGIEPLLPIFEELRERGVPGRVLTTDYLGFSDPAAMRKLASISNIEVRLYRTEGNRGFHTKGYIFNSGDVCRFLIGSSNLTGTALATNREWNARLVSKQTGAFARALQAEFRALWDHPLSRPLHEVIDAYEAERRAHMAAQIEVMRRLPLPVSPVRPEPNSMQRAFVENLLRIAGSGERRALLISATGTGKTYAAAFAVRELKPRRMLFVVHREQIARQAMASFRRVLGEEELTFGLLGGGQNEAGADCVFATMQTLARERVLGALDPKAFDVIIIDEVHRAAAESYRKIMAHFEPKLWFYGIEPSAAHLSSVFGFLSNRFVKTADEAKQRAGMVFVEYDAALGWRMAAELCEELGRSAEFRTMLAELAGFMVSRYEARFSKRYAGTDLVLYEKYTYEDVCRLLNWPTNMNAQNIGGYFYEKTTKTMPVFVNYHKAEGAIAYEDRFVSPSHIVALSKTKRRTTSADADHIYKRTPEDKDNRILLFVRRNKEDKGEAKAFYFLGEVEAQGEPVPVTLPATGDRAFEIDYRLDVPVRSDIYAYVTMAED